MRHLLGLALFLLSPMCLAADALACSCQPPPPKIAYEKSGAVFVGEYVGPSTSRFRGKRADARRFEVKKRWKGNLAGTVALPYSDTAGWCHDLKLTKGQEYLIYANSFEGELIVVVDFCGRSRNAKDAAEDFKYLEQLGSRLNGPPNNGMQRARK